MATTEPGADAWRKDLQDSIKASGRLQQDVARAAGISADRMSHLVRGVRRPSQDEIQRLAAQFANPRPADVAASFALLDDYQRAALRTANRGKSDLTLAIYGLGVAGEAGEVAELIKKAVGHGHVLDRAKLVKELGDVLWYVSAIADQHDIALAEIAGANIAKLLARYPDGFSHEASRNRPDGEVPR